MNRVRAAVTGASLTLQHVPDLVRYGSKPVRERDAFRAPGVRLRTFDQAVSYPPNQVFVGNLPPERLWDLPRPWWGEGPQAPSPAASGPSGEVLGQAAFYDTLRSVDQFDLVRMGSDIDPRPDELPLFDGAELVGAIRGDHPRDESLRADVLLENLAAKAGAVHALRHLLAKGDLDPASIGFVISCGEEAVGDRYQRGGGGLGKSIAEAAGLTDAGALDVKAFCAAPLHAIVLAASLVESGVHDRVVVVAGGSLAKLGMKFEAAVRAGVPVLEDVLAGMAVLVEKSAGNGPVIRLDAVGTHRVAAGASQQALLEDLVAAPLERIGRKITDVPIFATELHNPEVTEPAQGGDVPDRNYRMIAALAAMRGEIQPVEVGSFVRAHGLPGFSPTQGHIASAVPWLPHALARFAAGELSSTMLIAKGSLFLGRMTRLWDGVSIVLEA